MRLAAARPATADRLIILAAVLSGLALLYGLLVGGEHDVGLGGIEERRGYYLEGATLTEMGADGRPRIVVRARTIEQQLADDSVLLTGVELDYSADRSERWTMTARRGRMPPDRSSVMLAGDVTVTGVGERGSPVIVTDYLTYDTNSDYIQTSEKVNIRFGNHVLAGRGLRVNLNDGTLRLESNVNGHFNP